MDINQIIQKIENLDDEVEIVKAYSQVAQEADILRQQITIAKNPNSHYDLANRYIEDILNIHCYKLIEKCNEMIAKHIEWGGNRNKQIDVSKVNKDAIEKSRISFNFSKR